MVSVMRDMLDTHMPTVSMDIPMPMPLDTLTSAHLPVPALLDLPPLPSQPLLEDTLVLEDTSPTPPELSMLLSVRLRPRLIPPFSMEVLDMPVSAMLDTHTLMDLAFMDTMPLDTPMSAHLLAPALLDLLPPLSPLLLEDTPVPEDMLPTLPELFMLPKKSM